MSTIRRASVVALMFVLVTAMPALAQTYPPSVAPTGDVAGGGGAEANAAGTAFTGSGDIGTGTIVGIALLLIGLTSLFVGWRRAERVTGPR
jgi:hypothetical protein